MALSLRGDFNGNVLVVLSGLV